MPTGPANDLIVVTCASGKQASHLVPLLAREWTRLRLVVHSASSEARLKAQYPQAEVTRADLASPADAQRVLKGATAVVHVGPPFHPHETEIGYNVIDAAVHEHRTGAFQHFVYSSVLNSQLRKMLNHDGKRYVEEALLESGLSYTILQPAHFVDNFPLAALRAQGKEEGGGDLVFPAAFDPSIPFSFVALRDLAEAGARVLRERERHYFAQYPVCSFGPYTYNQLCEMVGAELGKRIQVKPLPYMDAVDGMLKRLYGEGADVHPASRDAAQRMLLYYNYRGLVGNTNVLEWLLGRKPTSCQEWVWLQIG